MDDEGCLVSTALTGLQRSLTSLTGRWLRNFHRVRYSSAYQLEDPNNSCYNQDFIMCLERVLVIVLHLPKEIVDSIKRTAQSIDEVSYQGELGRLLCLQSRTLACCL